MPKEKKILSCFSTFDKLAYEKGQVATERKKNPYPKETNKFYNWNRGKNEAGLNKI